MNEKIIGTDGKEIELSINVVAHEKKFLEKQVDDLQQEIELKRKNLEECQGKLYGVSLQELHLKEIYRLAALHFSRLRKEKEAKLSASDILELEKWIRRVRTKDGLKDIADALGELKKYLPSDIKSNLYALVQKIIIEGAYSETKRKK